MRYVLRNGALVEKSRAQTKTVHVISDAMPPVKHMGTGRWHDSKSEFRKDTKAIGAEEAGNDPQLLPGWHRPQCEPGMSELAAEVKRSIEQLRSR